MRNNKAIRSICTTTVLLIGIQFSFGQSNRFEVIKNLELIDAIYEHLDKYYVENPKPGSMSVAGINAMLEDLDPYTVFYPESDIEDYRLMTTGQYGGIGAMIRKMDANVYIAEPYENSPASNAGLRAGDKILSIDGRSMENKNTEDVSTNLKGPKGTTISIKIERPNGKQETVQVTRDEIKLPDIPYAGMLDNEVGYVKLTSFTPTASAEVRKNFLELKEKGMNKFVLDLRGNGGGLLIEAVHIVNMFVPKGQTVVETKGRIVEENREYKTMNEPLDLNIPLVVLIDGTSASASEIVAGSLQDLDRAVIVGETSFGKGLVQRTFDLKYGTKMKLTISKYYTPSGRCVQRLEYFDKNEDTKPEDIPDSLLHTFKTKNGREVIDGRGIVPDISVEIPDLSRLTATIYANNLLFNFATDYVKTHPEIAEARAYKLSDEDYALFKKQVLEDDFTYSTASEELLKKMKATIEREKLDEDSKAEYDALMAKVTPSKERDLDKYQDEVKMLLENEIVSRYYYQKGRVLNSFNHDDILTKGIEILKNAQEYNTILKK
ncbi:S41 family peptidase [Crocinitomicaceae bacterium CZZ-1]|uniref:S41 family peptidase n=1 Tax=Taishania pollutisoli TaxID=2766479 RepID=A0A8J6P8M3_9FLAO|nr:S41 family peptidase [Taishania pollutisoli]MBC9812151.1 S41 family peptidase [Taishania pollutisoli]NGF74688.1 S41 family peptidase [Fluviicola sp. SGL-29]